MTNVSTLAQSNAQLDRLKNLQLQMAALQRQMATGKNATIFQELGANVMTSERSRASLNAIEAYDSNIDTADRRLKLMLNALSEVKTQAGNILHAVEIQTQQGEFEMDAVTDLAKKTKNFIENLINARDGDRFLFGGAETQGQPLSDTGTLDTYQNARMGEWISGTITTDQLIDSYRDTSQLTDTIMGYSVTLSSGNPKGVSIRVDSYTEIDYTVFGNDTAFRDIMAATGMLESIGENLDKVALAPGDPLTTVTAPGADKSEQNDNFYRVFNDIAKMISDALDRVDQIEYGLSQTHATITKIQDNNKVDKNVLQDQISSVEDADMNEVSVKLNALRVQMEASYTVTSWLRDLNLVNFLFR